jgi:hypothetical protein
LARIKRKLTAAERRAKKEWKKKYQWIFINGKRVKCERQPLIDGIPVDDWIKNNADPIWLHQNEMWEYMDGFDDDLSPPTMQRETPSKPAPLLDDDFPF